MVVTLQDFKGRIGAILDEITTLTSNISDSYDTFLSSRDEDATIEIQIRDFKEKTQMYNRLFQEEEMQAEKNGGRKKRARTLQEYVLWFFLIAYLIFLIASFTYVNVHYGLNKALQISVVSCLIIIPVIVIMVKYM